jgi:outer membrane lipoprotein-sorting protein
MKKPIAIALLNLAVTSASWSLTPPEIFARVEAKYAGLTSIAFDGTVVSAIDTSGAPNGGAAHTSVTNYKVRLARPTLYRIEWNAPAIGSFVNEGAAWSSGGRHHISIAGKVTEHDNLDFALGAATGISGGATHTIPNLFFQRPSSLLRSMANVTALPDENVGGLDCYVVSGDVAGQKQILWITKEFLVIQKRHILGGDIDIPEVSDADMKKSLEELKLSSTPEAVAQMKQTIQLGRELSARTKGSITETVESIELNPLLKKELFDTKDLPSLPR